MKVTAMDEDIEEEVGEVRGRGEREMDYDRVNNGPTQLIWAYARSTATSTSGGNHVCLCGQVGGNISIRGGGIRTLRHLAPPPRAINTAWHTTSSPHTTTPTGSPYDSAMPEVTTGSKEEVRETSKGGSPFIPKIQDKPVPPNFRLSILEPYDGSTDPSKHVVTFRAQMALYDTSDALMCRAFPMILRGPARMWYNRLKSSSIASFDHLVREFELKFMASSLPRPTTTSLLGLTQGSDEPLAQFVSKFTAEVRRMPDTHPSLAI
ncbi:hypothetical protein B296_00048682 [Ensete ventricosum]|uniref:Retrotransposon gag domain-containing protein n=1 Tax=Ensete ventricosum TaxID=4639 RepID=A0A426Y504_ENSVE|nr:hypothetical protein B296_00048682 [Ensete ventricosum]